MKSCFFEAGSPWDVVGVGGCPQSDPGSEVIAPHCTSDLGVLGALSNPSLFAIQAGTIDPDACFQNLGKQMFLLIFFSHGPKCSLEFSLGSELAFFSFPFYF